MTAGQEQAALAEDGAKPQTFRSPIALVVWWLWVLFALGNLIDLAVQGRDHLSVVAAFILLLITGVMYVTALRPRIVAGGDLRIFNPLRAHLISWATVTGFDSTDLVRVRCEWPLDGGTGKRAIYSWALHSSRRRQVAARMRAERTRMRPSRVPAFGAPARYPADDQPTIGDTEHVVTALNSLAEQARAAGPAQPARAPLSTWYWPGLAALVIPAIALVIAILALHQQIPRPA